MWPDELHAVISLLREMTGHRSVSACNREACRFWATYLTG